MRNALDVGYRAVDTAQIYGNEAEAWPSHRRERRGTQRSVPDHQKIWVENYGKAKLDPQLQDSLKQLRTDYVDLTLIHWPAPGNGVELSEYMEALADAKAQGLTRQIGTSNFNIEFDPPGHRCRGQGPDRHQPDRTQPLSAG